MEDNNNVNLQDDINDVNFIDEDFPKSKCK